MVQPNGIVAEQERLVTAERRRIGRDLHDGVIQSLYAVGLRLESLTEYSTLPEDVKTALGEILQDLRATMTQMRTYVDQLTHSEAYSLEQMLRGLVDELQRRLDVSIDLTVAEGTDLELEAQVLHEIEMIVREAATNAVRHGKARRIAVTWHGDAQCLQLSISDDGRGFMVAKEYGSARHGLRNIRERAELLGGRLEIDSAVGKGTTVRLEIPRRTMR